MSQTWHWFSVTYTPYTQNTAWYWKKISTVQYSAVQNSSTTVMWNRCLKQITDFILRFSINASFYWGAHNYVIYYIYIIPNFTSGRGVGEAGNRKNYQECQFHLQLIQCQTSTDILGMMNEFVQYVQNYFQYAYLPN